MDKTPKHHGEFYFEPDAARWRDDLLKNRDKFFNEPFLGQTAPDARAYFKMPTDCPIVLTGHQPIFYYPGIWAKCLAVSQLAQSVGGVAYHKITDTALAPEFIHYLPEVDERDRVRRREVDFFATKDMKNKEKSVPYAFLPAPDREALKKILADAVNYGPTSVKHSMVYYLAKLIAFLKKEATWNQFHAYTLDLLDQICGTQRVKLEGSALWASEPFVDFFVYWVTHMAELNDDYNKSLDEYREKNGITHEIEPVPNLKFEDFYFETPFWGTAHAHHRDTVWVKMDRKELTLKVKGVEGFRTFRLDNLKTELFQSTLKIWPKAIPQTIFCRMYLCDYFVHGIGGGVYEEVGDMFLKRLIKTDPPAYGVVSATYLLDFNESKNLDVIVDYKKDLEQWKRALEQNPEYLFTRREDWMNDLPEFIHPLFEGCFQNEGLKKLADEKKELLSLLKDPLQKSQAAKRIKELNGELQAGYAEVLKAIENGLFEAQTMNERQNVLAFREYPFFCFDKSLFVDMREKIQQAFSRGST